MSYNVLLVGPNDMPCKSEPFEEGGTHRVGGTTECNLNITGNYWQVWDLMDWSPRSLHGYQASTTIPVLELVRSELGGDKPNPPKPWSDYWAPTPGNCLQVVERLLKFAKDNPEGRWVVEG